MTPAYPPPANRTIPWFQINLDVTPHDRWNEVVTFFDEGINAVIDEIFEHLDWRVINDLLAAIQGNEAEILARYPNGYGEEIQGISDLTGIETAKLILLNAAYELLGVCTSIVAQDTNGNVYHGRNLDFGLGLAFNFSDFQWGLTEALRPILFNAEMMKNNQTLYKATFFAGYVGVLTGVRKQAMTITVDSRFDNNYDKYLLDWFLNPDDTDQWLTFTTRNAIETYNTYNDALNYLSKEPYIGPAYIIIGGSQVNEGSVITLGPNHTLVDVWSIPHGLPTNDSSVTPWYVLETNYDHWNQPPWFDDRRYPAEDCMNEIGSANITLPNLYNVLNGLPNRNRLTTYTALMDCAEGHLESYYQYCTEIDCSPW
jgi:acid ceramidase